MMFGYDPIQKKYFFWERVDESHCKAVEIPIGNFIIDFLSMNLIELKSFLESVDENTFYFSGEKVFANNLISKNTYLLKLILENYFRNKRAIPSLDIDELIVSYSGIQEDITDFFLTGKFERETYTHMLLSGCCSDMTVSFQPYEDMSGIYARYKTNKVFEFLSLELMNVVTNSIKINLCENCGKFFIPENRSDEIYCSRIYKNGKTCKQLGYENKLKTDPFKAEYRKAYKTQHAKIKRNLKNIPNYKEKYFDPWVLAAKNAMEKFRSENNLDAFIQWIREHHSL